MDTGRTVNPSSFGNEKVRFLPPPPTFPAALAQHGRGVRLRSERFPVRIRGAAPAEVAQRQRQQVESLSSVGSSPSLGTRSSGP